MKKSARKAKESLLTDTWNARKDRRAARLDVNWRAEELADTDVWRRRTPQSPRTSRG